MKHQKRANSRIRLLVLAFVGLFAVALVRAAWIQVVDGNAYAAMASKQQRETIEIPAGRGTIFDRTGEPLAIGELATTVYADPRHIVSPRKAAIKAGQTLGIDPDSVFGGLSDRTKRFIYVERKADPAKAKSLQKLGLAGIGFYPEERRTYPQGRVAAQLLGFAEPTTAVSTGSRARSTRSSREAGLRDRRARPRGAGDRRRHLAQGATGEERRADARPSAAGDRRAAPGVSRAPLGREGCDRDRDGSAHRPILAMANAPTFDANRFSTAPADERRNRAVTDLYEPGSTFKIVTIAGALEDNVVTPDTSFTLAPTIQVADRVIHESHIRGTERMTVRQILSESSNVGTITIAKDRLAARSSPAGSRASDSGSGAAPTCRARAPAWSCRTTTGRARRSGTCRSGRGSR